MKKEKEAVIRRIRKMLKMAEGKANANEAGVAAAMAEKLMRKYNLDHADVLIEETTEDDIIAHESKIKYGARVPTWVGAIIFNCAKLHDCEAKYTLTPHNGRVKKVVTFLGETADATVAAYVFEYLNKEIRRLANAFRNETGLGRREADAFRKGAALEVNRMMRRMIDEKEAELRGHSTGKALVVRKGDLIKQKFKVSYSKGRAMNLGDMYASQAGREAGRGINIRKGLEGGVPKKQLT